MAIKNKRGSHIGVIISFVIFIGLIVFIYTILRPAVSSNQSGGGTLANQLKLSLESNMSGNLTEISVYADSTSDCVNLSDFVSYAGLESPPHIIVKSKTGSDFSSNISSSNSNDLYVIKSSDPSSKFLYIYDSPEFNQTLSGTPGSCSNLAYGGGSGDYTIGQVKTNSYIFESSILKLIKDYDNNYYALRSYFGVTGGDNFGFNFIYDNGTSTETQSNIPSTANVYSQYFTIEYVNVNGNIESGNLIIKVW